jgi:hypothetical protein
LGKPFSFLAGSPDEIQDFWTRQSQPFKLYQSSRVGPVDPVFNLARNWR